MHYNSDKPDVMMSVKELNSSRKKMSAFILLIDNVMIATGTEHDMNKYLKWEDSLLLPEQELLDEVSLLHGFLLDPAEMPYDIPPDFMKDRSIYVIEAEEDDRVRVEECQTTEEAAYLIESAMAADEDLTIDDFAVIVAKQGDIGYAIASSHTFIKEDDVYG